MSQKYELSFYKNVHYNLSLFTFNIGTVSIELFIISKLVNFGVVCFTFKIIFFRIEECDLTHKNKNVMYISLVRSSLRRGYVEIDSRVTAQFLTMAKFMIMLNYGNFQRTFYTEMHSYSLTVPFLEL